MASREHDGGLPPGASADSPVFVISVAAQLSGLHAQTLRSYDRLGLVSPGRSAGGGRRYSARDIALLREQLARVAELLDELRSVRDAAEQAAAMVHRSYRRDLVPVDRRHHVVVWHPERPE